MSGIRRPLRDGGTGRLRPRWHGHRPSSRHGMTCVERQPRASATVRRSPCFILGRGQCHSADQRRRTPARLLQERWLACAPPHPHSVVAARLGLSWVRGVFHRGLSDARLPIRVRRGGRRLRAAFRQPLTRGAGRLRRRSSRCRPRCGHWRGMSAAAPRSGRGGAADLHHARPPSGREPAQRLLLPCASSPCCRRYSLSLKLRRRGGSAARASAPPEP
jgi:hypothetical protein